MPWVHRLKGVNVKGRKAVCANCGPVDVVWHKRWVCSVAKKAHRGKSDWRKKPGPHGLTPEQARAFTAGKTCAICGKDKRLVVDHCHQSGRIRGVLCLTCNAGLGMFKDMPDLLLRAVGYLSELKKAPRERGLFVYLRVN